MNPRNRKRASKFNCRCRYAKALKMSCHFYEKLLLPYIRHQKAVKHCLCVVFEKDKMLIVKQTHSRPSYEICLTFCFLSITKIFSLKTFTTKAIKRGRFRILNNTLNKYLLRSICIIDIITINKNETI